MTALVVGENQLQSSVIVGTPEDGSTYLAVAILPGGVGFAFEAEAFMEGKPVGGSGPALGEIGSAPLLAVGFTGQRCGAGQGDEWRESHHEIPTSLHPAWSLVRGSGGRIEIPVQGRGYLYSTTPPLTPL